jgi:hypothetical protein
MYTPTPTPLGITRELTHLNTGKPSKRDATLATLCAQATNTMTAAQWLLSGNAMEMYASDVMYFKHHADKLAHVVARMLTNQPGAQA